jgi:hypothetical protein
MRKPTFEASMLRADARCLLAARGIAPAPHVEEEAPACSVDVAPAPREDS